MNWLQNKLVWLVLFQISRQIFSTSMQDIVTGLSGWINNLECVRRLFPLALLYQLLTFLRTTHCSLKMRHNLSNTTLFRLIVQKIIRRLLESIIFISVMIDLTLTSLCNIVSRIILISYRSMQLLWINI